MNVGIVEDQFFYQNYLSEILENEFDYSVVAICKDGNEAVQKCITENVELLILDLKIPGLHGLDVAAELVKALPLIKILAFSGEINPYSLKIIESLGALGYIDKSDDVMKDESFLLNAIQTVASGKRCYSPNVEALRKTLTSGDSYHKILSPKKIEVLKLVGKCMTDEEISEQLGVTIFAIRKHRGEMIQLLELESNHALIRYAQKNGLVYD